MKPSERAKDAARSYLSRYGNVVPPLFDNLARALDAFAEEARREAVRQELLVCLRHAETFDTHPDSGNAEFTRGARYAAWQIADLIRATLQRTGSASSEKLSECSQEKEKKQMKLKCDPFTVIAIASLVFALGLWAGG